MEQLYYNESLSELEGLSLEKGRVQGDLIMAFQHLRGTYKINRKELFSRAWADRTRGSRLKFRVGLG